jgi:hypothetical protein
MPSPLIIDPDCKISILLPIEVVGNKEYKAFFTNKLNKNFFNYIF